MPYKEGGRYDQKVHEMRNGFANKWESGDIIVTPCHKPCETYAPCWCLASVVCPCCMSYNMRYRALYNRMDNYQCCAGYMPCSGHCGESSAPEVCLALETVCCFSQSVLSTRFLLQDDLRIQNSKCDNCLMAFAFCLQQLSCICDIIAMFDRSFEDAANLIDLISDLVFCSMCACMQAQHKIQLDVRDAGMMPNYNNP
mmetsp:Transcript_34533/g.65973  ORF Transcript_34533/g.65973 Transcript_34533/m.65973 type:complete len:198 (-) Transcript_34533:12-605(-)